MSPCRVLIPLPDSDFDPTEAAVSWKVVRDAGHEVVFATEKGSRPSADPRMISGEGLDAWGFLPGLKRIRLVGLLLRAKQAAREAYAAMENDPAFLEPLQYAELRVADYDGLILPGGHARGMRPYLENQQLQRFVASFFETQAPAGGHKPVGAICHGVLLAARAISPTTGRSVLHGRKTTALTWSQEEAAWRLTKYFARFWDSTYYRTYSESSDEPYGHWGVEAEVKRALAGDADFLTVPPDVEHAKLKTDNLHRDTETDERPAWVVRDGNYVSARWPGDAHTFARRFVGVLEEQGGESAT